MNYKQLISNIMSSIEYYYEMYREDKYYAEEILENDLMDTLDFQLVDSDFDIIDNIYSDIVEFVKANKNYVNREDIKNILKKYDIKEPPIKENTKNLSTNTRYFIRDYIYDEEKDMYEFSEFKTKEAFLDSLEYNYSVAEEYGDEIDSLKKIQKDFEKNKNWDIDLNGFQYIKLTNTSLEDYLGEDEEIKVELLDEAESKKTLEKRI